MTDLRQETDGETGSLFSKLEAKGRSDRAVPRLESSSVRAPVAELGGRADLLDGNMAP